MRGGSEVAAGRLAPKLHAGMVSNKGAVKVPADPGKAAATLKTRGRDFFRFIIKSRREFDRTKLETAGGRDECGVCPPPFSQEDISPATHFLTPFSPHSGGRSWSLLTVATA